MMTASRPSSTRRRARSTRELGEGHVPLGGMVEAGGDDLAHARHLHLAHFLGPLVHQQDEELRLGMVVRDARGDGLQHRGLAGLGGGHDQRALAEAEGGDEVDEATGHVALPARGLGALQLEHAARVHRGKPVEVGAAAGLLGGAPVDRGELPQQRRLAATGREHLARRVRRPSAGRTRARCARPRARHRAAGPTPCFAGAGNPGARRVRGRRGFRVLSYAQGLSSSVWDAAAPEGRGSGAAERARDAARCRRR